MKKNTWMLLTLVGVGSLYAGLFQNSPPSAFDARGIAEKKVSEKAHDQVIHMYGVRSSDGLYPTTWKILFWDSTAAQNGRSVTVSKGEVSEIKDGYTELEHVRLAAYKQDEVIDSKLLKCDSTDALAKVMKAPALKGVKLSSVEFMLAKNEGAVQPIWNLKLSTDHAGKEIEIGQVKMSAETGEIFTMSLQLEKMNNK